MAGHHPWREIRGAADDPTALTEIVARLLAQSPPEGASPEHKAIFWLTHATDAADYADARHAVRTQLGLDSSAVPHDPPPQWSSANDEDPASSGGPVHP